MFFHSDPKLDKIQTKYCWNFKEKLLISHILIMTLSGIFHTALSLELVVMKTRQNMAEQHCSVLPRLSV